MASRELRTDDAYQSSSLFFRELFNDWFPVDFRIKQCQKLLRCYQNDQKVPDYIYKLTVMSYGP